MTYTMPHAKKLAVLVPLALAACGYLHPSPEQRAAAEKAVPAAGAGTAPAASPAATSAAAQMKGGSSAAKPVVAPAAMPVTAADKPAGSPAVPATSTISAPAPAAAIAPPTSSAPVKPAPSPSAPLPPAPAASTPSTPSAASTAASPPVVAGAAVPAAAVLATVADAKIYTDGSRVFPGTGQFTKPAAQVPAPAKGTEEFSLNFEQVDIRAVAQSILGDYLRETFTIHPQATGTATIRTSRPVARAELIPILEMLLRQNGLVMVREEGMYKIQPQALGTRGSITPQVATTPAALPNGYSAQIVQLKYAGVRDMARILEPYAVEPQSSIRTDELRNLLILSGTQRELKHMMEVIDLFDVDYLAGFSVGLFPMQTDVKTLAADLDRIFGGSTAAAAPGTPAAAAGSVSPLAGIVRIVPVERLNGLLVITTQPRYLEEARKWIDRLDKGGGLAGGMRLNVYAVQHGRADKLAQLLSDVYGNRSGSGGAGPTLAPGLQGTTTANQARPAGTTTPAAGQGGGAFGAFFSSLFQSSGTAVSKDTRIIPDNDNNSLLILASPADYETILAALRKLDVPRRQVLVEVLVAEVTLTDDLKFGIEWFMTDPRNGLFGALRNASGGAFGSVLPQVPPTGVVDPRGPASNPLIKPTDGLQLINVSGGQVRAVIQALGQDGRARVESAPKLLVLDNEKGTVNVGTRISVETGQSTGTGTGGNIVTTRQYIDTGVLLTVTPRINAGGRVTMEINQEVSSAGAASATTNPPINTRKAQTTINVASGETMVLAGLIQTDRGSGSQGVPLLSKIPIIGGLFGTQTYRNNRTELVVLITPTVVSTSEDVQAVTDELRKKLPSLQHIIPKKKDAADKE